MRLKDVKEFIKNETINKYDPVCKSFLRIYKNVQIPRKVNQEYDDNIFLKEIIFDEPHIIYVGITKKECIC